MYSKDFGYLATRYFALKFRMSSRCKDCDHSLLQLDPSPFASRAGYTQPTYKQRATATSCSGSAPKPASSEPKHTFPAPLVLPHDDLNYDPDCSPQSVKSWLHMKSRNKLKDQHARTTLYVGRFPVIDEDVAYIRAWTAPLSKETAEQAKLGDAETPATEDLINYLRAFYHGLTVEELQTSFTWVSWGRASQPRRSVSLPKYMGLAHDNECTRVRVRRAPDGAFFAQFNLNDIIDAAMAILPADAYALVLLVDHDIYESEEDEFCCGRAYGSSRVAVVQAARYNPLLDAPEKIDRLHMWPLSHCKTYIDELCAAEEVYPKPLTASQAISSRESAMRAAIDAAAAYLKVAQYSKATSCLWFSRLARTVSHELGHCFGMAHCVYYACNMQGTAGMKEDVRQPPYLCPICEAKVAHAIVVELNGDSDEEKRNWMRERLYALSGFCESLEGTTMDAGIWRGMNAWIIQRLSL